MTKFQKTENIINFLDVFCRGAALHEVDDQDTGCHRDDKTGYSGGTLTCPDGMHGEINCHFISRVGNFY